MQKDVAAGRAPELDAIAGPVQRGGARHGIPVPATAELAGLVAARAQGGEA
jgi:ketopantoate reductase